jgi:hypothetical protein
VGQLKSLRDALDGDPVIVVCEAKRGMDGSSGYPDGLGTARGARTADIVLVLRSLTDPELAGALKTTRERDGRVEVDPQKLAEAKDALRGQGKAYVRLEIAKGRDGVQKTAFDLTHWYRRSRFEEGRR